VKPDLITEINRRLRRRARTPKGGGWATDRTLTERRLIRLKPDTLARLERLARYFSTRRKRIGPMLLAALLLELAVERQDEGGK
jgi:hypothetical protein